METSCRVGGTRSLPGICFLQHSGSAGSMAGCARPTKISKKNPLTRSQQSWNNTGTTLASLAFGEEGASSPSPPPASFPAPPQGKAAKFDPEPSSQRSISSSRPAAVPLGASRGKKNHVSLPGAHTYHMGITFAIGNGHTQIGHQANWHFTDQYDPKAPGQGLAFTEVSWGCGGLKALLFHTFIKSRPCFWR